MDKLLIDISNNCIDTLTYEENTFELSNKIFCSPNIVNIDKLELFKDIIKENTSIKTVIFSNMSCIFENIIIPQNVDSIIFNHLNLIGTVSCSLLNIKILQFNSVKEITTNVIIDFYKIMPNVECIIFNKIHNDDIYDKIIDPDELENFHLNEMKFLYKLLDSFTNLKKLIYPIDDRMKEIFEKTYPNIKISRPY